MTGLVAAARAWGEDCLVRGVVPAQIDLDELTSDLPPVGAVSAALDCGIALREAVRASEQLIDVAVVIPLPGDEVGLPTSAPTLGDLFEVAWIYGPGREVPGLYLVPPSVWGTVEPGEEYRRTLDEPSVPPGFFAYYRAWRSELEVARGWEFARAVYVRSLPSGGSP